MASEREWRERVRTWRASGESAATFAARTGCNARTLAWWSSRLRAKGRGAVRLVRVVPSTALATSGASKASAVRSEASARVTVDVLLAGGLVVRVGPEFDPALLRAVLAALEPA